MTIVIKDIAIPRLGGIEVTKLLRKHCLEIKVLIPCMTVAGIVLKRLADVELVPAIGAICQSLQYFSSPVVGPYPRHDAVFVSDGSRLGRNEH